VDPPVEVSAIVPPGQYGPPLFAVGIGSGFTTTAIVPVPTQPLASVTEILYVPEAAAVAAAIVGFCAVDEKALGPVQDQLTPLEQVKFRAVPTQIGELLAIPGTRLVLTVTVVFAVAVQPATVTVTVYTPAIPAVAAPGAGFCAVEVNPKGPLQE
jgi:hypothetical protein